MNDADIAQDLINRLKATGCTVHIQYANPEWSVTLLKKEGTFVSTSSGERFIDAAEEAIASAPAAVQARAKSGSEL